MIRRCGMIDNVFVALRRTAQLNPPFGAGHRCDSNGRKMPPVLDMGRAGANQSRSNLLEDCTHALDDRLASLSGKRYMKG